jgi:hypothetical protein
MTPDQRRELQTTMLTIATRLDVLWQGLVDLIMLVDDEAFPFVDRLLDTLEKARAEVAAATPSGFIQLDEDTKAMMRSRIQTLQQEVLRKALAKRRKT